MTQLFSNNADTTLSEDLPSSGLGCFVVSAANFAEPTGDEYQLITLTAGGVYEICRMTERGATAMTLVRAQEGTTAQNWSAGTRVFAGVTGGTMSGLYPAAGSSFVQSLDPGDTALGANAVNLQKARTDALDVASGADAVAIGNRSRASAQYAASIGYQAQAIGFGSAALGPFTSAESEGSVAIQGGACVAATTLNAGALPAAVPTDWQWGNADAFVGNGTMEAVVLSAPVALTAGGTITCPVPAGSTFYADEVGLIVETADTVTVQPEISFGVTGDNAKLLAAVTTTELDAVKKRQRFGTLLSAHGETSYTFTVTTAATATALTARVYWRGFAVQDVAA